MLLPHTDQLRLHGAATSPHCKEGIQMRVARTAVVRAETHTGSPLVENLQCRQHLRLLRVSAAAGTPPAPGLLPPLRLLLAASPSAHACAPPPPRQRLLLLRRRLRSPPRRPLPRLLRLRERQRRACCCCCWQPGGRASSAGCGPPYSSSSPSLSAMLKYRSSYVLRSLLCAMTRSQSRTLCFLRYFLVRYLR